MLCKAHFTCLYPYNQKGLTDAVAGPASWKRLLIIIPKLLRHCDPKCMPQRCGAQFLQFDVGGQGHRKGLFEARAFLLTQHKALLGTKGCSIDAIGNHANVVAAKIALKIGGRPAGNSCEKYLRV